MKLTKNICNLLVGCLLATITGYSQRMPLKFERLSIEHGLAQSTVGYIYQDSRGYVWFGTGMGLHRYDGYQFRVYQNDPDNPHSISNNDIWHIAEDTSGALWIATYGGGLNLLDHQTGKFIRWRHDPNDASSIASDRIICLLVDRSGLLWLGTEGAGLLQAQKNTNSTLSFTQWQHDPDDPYSLSHNEVVCLYEDVHGELWIGTNKGLNRLDRETGTFTRFLHQSKDSGSLSNNYIEGITGDLAGKLWIATHGGGLQCYDRQTATFADWKHEPGNGNSLSTNFLYSIEIDHSGIIWIGTDNAGLDRFDPSTNAFMHFKHETSDPGSLSDNIVISMLEDRSGVLWIGTSEGGLSRLTTRSRTPGSFVHWKNNPIDTASLRHNRVWSFAEDKDGSVWIATKAGLNRFDRKSGSFDFFAAEPENPANLSNYITTVLADEDGFIWFGTWGEGAYRFNPQSGSFTALKFSHGRISTMLKAQSGNIWIARQADGLIQYDPHDENIQFFRHDADDLASLNNDDVQCLFEDRQGNLWVGTDGSGLNRFNRETRTFAHWKSDPSNRFSLSSNVVRCMYEDRIGNLWIGTAGGLNRFDIKTGRFLHYGKKDGLADEVICGILEDKKGNLWLSTHGGLSKFNPASGEFRNYTVQDGLQSNEFNRGAYCLSRRGDMFFGGVNGFNTFFPDSIKDNPCIPPIVITGFQMLNRTVDGSSNGEPPLEKDVSDMSEIVISFRDRLFSFGYAALDYNAPGLNQYAYKMENFDEEWINAGTRRFATYTNLNPGSYIFRVKGSNNDGLWNEEGAAIRIVITPPWWQTWWAYTLYAGVAGLVFYLIRRHEMSKLRLVNALQMQRFEAEKLREIDQMKSRFFTNISHEFRTPLTLIMGPLKNLLSENFQDDVKRQFRMMLRNSERLTRLINQLLDLSRLEAGGMTLQARSEDLVLLLRPIISSFESLAKRRQISFSFVAPDDLINVYLDRDKLEKILYNLLANAFKFTPEHGAITVKVTKGGEVENERADSKMPCSPYVQIAVKDTGIGIPPDQLEKIFDRFYQTGEGMTGIQEGAGIGLALAKELVELHGGIIHVESDPGKGSTFVIRLPMGKKDLNSNEIVADASEPVIDSDLIADPALLLETGNAFDYQDTTQLNAQPLTGDRPLLLIVEDNPDMRNYMREVLQSDYNIREAHNGDGGLTMAIELIPDLVISDVMMPEMDGFSLCQRLKTDERTCHIPVILLTARVSQESKMEGLETGADDYLTKPFDAHELRVRVSNLIEQRRLLRERFSREIILQPRQIAVTSMDAQFLERAMNVIEEHFSDPDFTPEKFARQLTMSRMQLHRKLKALTNQTTGEFIRHMRLQRAAQLLTLHSGNVSEIAYAVGFNNLSYFAKCFRELFGRTPSEYANEY